MVNYNPMEDRLRSILELVIDHYIRLNQPVGSRYVEDQLEGSLSSATIRSLFRELEELGYLAQPHTSAGRIPTDEGYRYYVSNLPPHHLPAREREEIVAEMSEHPLAQVLAHRAHTLAISGWVKRGEVEEAGLSELLEQDSALQVLREISALLESRQDYLAQLAEQGREQTTVFIGEENPVFPSQHTTLIIRTIPRQRDQVVLVLAGPKRMAYQRNVALLNDVADIMMQRAL